MSLTRRGRLTSVEQSLVEGISRGEQLDLATEGEAVDEAAMRLWGKSRTCRASVVRDILLGRLAADPDPHGLRLRGPGSQVGLTWKISARKSISS